MLNITQLAKTAYLTGGKVTAKDAGKSVTADTTLKDLGFAGNSAKFKLTIGSETKELEFKADAKISDLVSSLKDAGLNASFDATNGRFSSVPRNPAQHLTLPWRTRMLTARVPWRCWGYQRMGKAKPCHKD